METGQRIIQPKNNIDELSPYILSIQVSLNGLSFCVLDEDHNSIVFYSSSEFPKRLSPADIQLKINRELQENTHLQKSFKAVKVVYDNDLSVLVPKSLFEEGQMANYLKFNARMLQSDFLTYDDIPSIDSVGVYIPYVNINNYLIDRFGSFEYRHLSCVLIEGIMKQEKNVENKRMYAFIQKGKFEILVVERNSLIMYNSFEYNSPEDFIYYILFTAEQLELNPETFEIFLFGEIDKDDDIFQICYKYIRHVEIMSAEKRFDIGSEVDKAVSRNFILINSF